jgi:hypothetical protein
MNKVALKTVILNLKSIVELLDIIIKGRGGALRVRH